MKKSQNVVKALSEHYFRNIELGIYYADLSLQANAMGMLSFSKYIKDLSDDKITIHKDLIINYLNSIGEDLIAKEMKPVEFKKFKNPKDLAKELLTLELEVRQEVNDIANIALKEVDFETFNFWQWFVKDGLKDYNEIEAINNAFTASNDLLLIDNSIEKLVKESDDSH